MAQEIVIERDRAAVHHPPCPPSPPVKDEHPPAPVHPAEFRAGLVDRAEGFPLGAVNPEKGAGPGERLKNTPVLKEGNHIRGDRDPARVPKVLVFHQVLVVPVLFSDCENIPHLRAALTALLTGKRHG